MQEVDKTVIFLLFIFFFNFFLFRNEQRIINKYCSVDLFVCVLVVFLTDE